MEEENRARVSEKHESEIREKLFFIEIFGNFSLSVANAL